MISGIYQITFTLGPVGCYYIGSSKNVFKRVADHVWALKRNKHNNHRLQEAFNEYKEYVADVLLECKIEDLYFMEQCMLDVMKPSLNISKRVDRARPKDYGEISAKVSASLLKYYENHQEERNRLANFIKESGVYPMKGRKHAAESKEKMRTSALKVSAGSSARMKAYQASLTPEERSEAGRKARQGKKMPAGFTKAVSDRMLRRNQEIGPEERSRRIIKINASQTPAQRSARVLKAWETRRNNKA